MVQQSSITAYNESVKDGTIPTQNRTILDVLFNSPTPMSNRMIAKVTGYETSAVAGRVNGLLKSGLVIETHYGKCPHTGRRVRFVHVKWPQQMEMKI
jgi:hypothetical protein